MPLQELRVRGPGGYLLPYRGHACRGFGCSSPHRPRSSARIWRRIIEAWKKNHTSGGIADESLDVSRASTVCRGLQGLGLDGEHNSPPQPRQASVTKRRNSQVERRNSQSDSPAPGAPAMRMRGFTN